MSLICYTARKPLDAQRSKAVFMLHSLGCAKHNRALITQSITVAILAQGAWTVPNLFTLCLHSSLRKMGYVGGMGVVLRARRRRGDPGSLTKCPVVLRRVRCTVSTWWYRFETVARSLTEFQTNLVLCPRIHITLCSCAPSSQRRRPSSHNVGGRDHLVCLSACP